MEERCDSCELVQPGSMTTDQTLSRVVEQLSASNNGLARSPSPIPGRHILPSREELVEIIDALRSVLFPGYFGPAELSNEGVRFHIGATLDRVKRQLQEQVKRGLCFVCERDVPNCPECDREAHLLTESFLESLPDVRRVLATDVRATYEGDPAATGTDEAILCYPGILAITSYRLAHELFRLDIPLLPRMITEHAHSITGIDIHPGAKIGDHFFIDHGTGIVIGETCVIGNRVRIYQGVTLGAKSFPLDEHGKPMKGIPRHPIVEDDVIIYSGATILGRITVGKGSVVGGNVWLTRSVEPGSRITQAAVRREMFQEGAGI